MSPTTLCSSVRARLIQNHCGKDEGCRGLQDGEGGFPVDRKELDRSPHEYMQKIWPLSLVHQLHARRKALQVTGSDQGFEVLLDAATSPFGAIVP